MICPKCGRSSDPDEFFHKWYHYYYGQCNICRLKNRERKINDYEKNDKNSKIAAINRRNKIHYQNYWSVDRINGSFNEESI